MFAYFFLYNENHSVKQHFGRQDVTCFANTSRKNYTAY